ncbi:MAG: heterodisulfide reductase-related iron-sulfur binding cluster [Candidatus Nezhaarchaeota archaeon]|nr:heterodisulfide reductase-related iron-sulfur binding cluster [Candidatus Nezhaarchaeota archaeon]MCX8142402.1 heterodisulfide reductase-related iron-sulfur binding cluster [Candidatus Nezhaarchaeota archaeon]MDW8050625.1 heterodisulfide reductase-related iron-sulfur binding cluster [Nitrososphaerota archaeon]
MILAWMGCTSIYRVPELARSFKSILHSLDVDHRMLGESEGCCGSILLRLGLRGEVLEIAKGTFNRVNQVHPQKLVTHCPGCLRTFKVDYPKIFNLSFSFEVEHSTQLILDYMDAKKLKPIDIRAVYFDPCHLGRHLNVYDEPRNLLALIPGLKLIEPQESKESSLCCGAGGGIKACFDKLAIVVAREVLNYFKTLEMEAVITACPFCYYNLKSASDGSIKVIDILQLIDKSLRGGFLGLD